MSKNLFESWNTRLKESSADNWQEQSGSKIYTSATSGLSDYECSTNTSRLAFVCACLLVSKTDFKAIPDKCRCHQTLLWGKITPTTSRNAQKQLSLGWRLKSLARLLEVEAKVCANLEQDNQQCALDRISIKRNRSFFCAFGSPVVSKHLLWGYVGWFSASPNHPHVSWNMAGTCLEKSVSI